MGSDVAIFKHADGTYRRYPPAVTPTTTPADDEYTNSAHWKQVPGAPRGVEVHRDGKTMRNTPPTCDE